MSKIANLVNTIDFSNAIKRFEFNISATVLAGADSPIYNMDIYPLTKGHINTILTKCASSTYTISLFDIEEGLPIFQETAINEQHLENNVGAMFYNTDSLLYCLLSNTDVGNATGVITISVVLQGNR